MTSAKKYFHEVLAAPEFSPPPGSENPPKRVIAMTGRSRWAERPNTASRLGPPFALEEVS